MPGRPLFVYGTLRDPEMIAAVLGRGLDPRNVAAAVAPGFRVVRYPGRVYPALVRAPGGRAAGEVILGLGRAELMVLDAFEGAEYRRGIVPVLIEGEMHEADGYLPEAPVPADAEPWTLAAWQLAHKAAVLPAEASAAAEIRAHLAAARPPRSPGIA